MGIFVEICAIVWTIVGIELAIMGWHVLKDSCGGCDHCATGSQY